MAIVRPPLFIKLWNMKIYAYFIELLQLWSCPSVQLACSHKEAGWNYDSIILYLFWVSLKPWAFATDPNIETLSHTHT